MKTPAEWKTLFESSAFARQTNYSGPLGPEYNPSGTRLRLWAPTAQKVSVNLYRRGDGGACMGTLPLEQHGQGVWSVYLPGDQHGKYYDFTLTTPFGTCNAADPYARAAGVNGVRSMIFDPARVDPQGWERDVRPVIPPARRSVWEVSVRDFSQDPASGVHTAWRGKFLAFTQQGTTLNGDGIHPTCLNYLKRLGVTHVQLQPIFDFATVDEVSGEDYNWTKELMSRIDHWHANAISLHYYTLPGDWEHKGSATDFDEQEYYTTISKAMYIENIIEKHLEIMDEHDPEHNIDLFVDEWGTWYDVEPGTNPGFLYQQNTMRDAFVASLSLDIFHKYTDRLKMANIAQVVNVLQSMILTKGKEMVLTPTYYVFKMYKVHQDATYLPIEISCQQMNVRDKRTLPLISATASKNKDGKIHISLSNVDVDNEQEVIVNLPGIQATKAAGEMLTSAQVTDYNSFENPDKVKLVPFKEVKINKGVLKIKLPAKSIVTVELQ